MTSQSGGGGASTLSGDSDVAIVSPAVSQALIYDGTHWSNRTPPGNELGYVQVTANQSTASTIFVDITSMSLTVTIGIRPILLEAFFSDVDHTVDGGLVVISFFDVTGATQVQQASVYAPTAGGGGHCFIASRLAPSSGVRTYKMQIRVGTAGTGNFAASSTQPAWFQIREA